MYDRNNCRLYNFAYVVFMVNAIMFDGCYTV